MSNRGQSWKAALLALMLLLGFNLLFSPHFFEVSLKQGHLYGSLIDILERGAPVMLLSLGMTLVIATGGIDLSVGAVMAIIGSLAALMVTKGLPFPEILAAGIGVSLLLGLWNGLLVAYGGVQPIVATLILMVSGRGAAQLLTNGQIIIFKNEGLATIGSGHLLGLPISVWLVVGLLCVLGLVTRRSALGLFIESVGDNGTASWYAGLYVPGVILIAYTLCALCAGLAGLVATGNLMAADVTNAGLYLELDAILAVVLGGTALTGGRFSLIGSVLGALVIQTLSTTILTKGVPAEQILVVKAVAVISVCLMQSGELRGRMKRKRAAA